MLCIRTTQVYNYSTVIFTIMQFMDEFQESRQVPSRYKEGKRPSGEITTGPSGKAFPSCEGDTQIISASNTFLT